MRELFDLPDAMASLPRDHRGYPIPAFVYFDEQGKEDFRIIKRGWREECHTKHKCWLCGGYLGSRKWFVLGPMCSVTRTTMEPPCHRLCAEFAVKNCPFLTKPLAKRGDLSDVPDKFVSGIMIDRNPGVTMIWETLSYKPFRDGMGGWLIEVGDPKKVTAWREGRHATRDELLESVRTGLPFLEEAAAKQGASAVHELHRTAMEWSSRILDRWFPTELNTQRGA